MDNPKLCVITTTYRKLRPMPAHLYPQLYPVCRNITSPVSCTWPSPLHIADTRSPHHYLFPYR